VKPWREVVRGGHPFIVEDQSITSSWQFWTLWANGEWEAPVLDWIDRLIHPGEAFLDVGAWIGPMTLWAASKGALVTAIEPDPEAFRQLQGNVIANHYERRVRLIQKAASPKPGNVSLWPVMEWGQSASSTVQPKGDPITVRSVNLIPIIRRTHPVLVKMDIEGGERDLFPAIGPALRMCNTPILLSVHQNVVTGDWGPMLEELTHWNMTRLAAAGEAYLATPK
jgi:FkbM family methyltransferase